MADPHIQLWFVRVTLDCHITIEHAWVARDSWERRYESDTIEAATSNASKKKMRVEDLTDSPAIAEMMARTKARQFAINLKPWL